MSSTEHGGVTDAVVRLTAMVIQLSPYGTHYYIFGAIVALGRYVVVSVPGGTPQAEVIRWAAAIACAVGFAGLVGLAVWDVLRRKKTPSPPPPLSRP